MIPRIGRIDNRNGHYESRSPLMQQQSGVYGGGRHYAKQPPPVRSLSEMIENTNNLRDKRIDKQQAHELQLATHQGNITRQNATQAGTIHRENATHQGAIDRENNEFEGGVTRENATHAGVIHRQNATHQGGIDMDKERLAQELTGQREEKKDARALVAESLKAGNNATEADYALWTGNNRGIIGKEGSPKPANKVYATRKTVNENGEEVWLPYDQTTGQDRIAQDIMQGEADSAFTSNSSAQLTQSKPQPQQAQPSQGQQAGQKPVLQSAVMSGTMSLPNGTTVPAPKNYDDAIQTYQGLYNESDTAPSEAWLDALRQSNPDLYNLITQQ